MFPLFCKFYYEIVPHLFGSSSYVNCNDISLFLESHGYALIPNSEDYDIITLGAHTRTAHAYIAYCLNDGL